jgi:hypothetical protein
MGQAVMAVVPWWNKGEQRTTWRKKKTYRWEEAKQMWKIVDCL